MFGLWTSFLDSIPGPVPPGQPDAARAWWQMTPDALQSLLSTGIEQINHILSNDPLLRTIDQTWNANPLRDIVPVDWGEVARALRIVWLRGMGRPETALASVTELNMRLWQTALATWNEAGQRWLEAASGPIPAAPKPTDKRFAAPEWQLNPAYRVLKEAYLLASDWLLKQGEANDLDEAERRRLTFHLRQFIDAASPTLMLFSNPAALRRIMETGGLSLVEGTRNLADDLRAGRLSMVDATAFAPGRNLALTPGKVVHRNRLMELIQYTPSTEQAHQVPLLIVPPWINKYYIMDMQPKNSMVRFLVAQGFTVFMISWKNPDASMEDITIEDYIGLGPMEASDVIRDITGSQTLNTMGYCIGGTLMTILLALLSAQGDKRFTSLTLMVSLQDFTRVGDTAVFIDEPAIELIEQQMMERGYLDSRAMSNMFNLLRSNDLIWSNVVNNYLMGEKPAAFDLLYWNSDGTRMTRAAHSWYLRNTYLENNLMVPGKVTLKGQPIDLGRITLDLYAVGAEKDHIVPWDAAWRVTQLVGSKVRFILASSGHIAGMINPPGSKGNYWTNDATPAPATPTTWLQGATKHDGTWWTDWTSWLAERSGPRQALPTLGNATHPPLHDAPGTYVLEK
ncbi:PHA/PHB synthase family protein [Rhodovastum atsumiense]|nr:class I poly(R)-hydroxyalkanoic acid synthase [Rhodovastum atsumiense]